MPTLSYLRIVSRDRPLGVGISCGCVFPNCLKGEQHVQFYYRRPKRPVYGSVVLVTVTLTIPVTERFFVKTPAAGNGAGGNSTGSGGPGAGGPPAGSGGTNPGQ